MRIRTTLTLAALLAACGNANPPPDDSIDGDATAGGEAACNLAETPIATYRLPELPEGFDLLEPTHREPWDQAMAVLQATAPAPPENADAAAIQEWAQGPFTEYIEQERTAMLSAEQALNGLSEQPEPVRVVASTLVGLMYMHMAGEISRTPIPSEVSEDAEGSAMYLSAIRAGVQPLLDVAADRAEYCVYAASTQPDALHRWRVYCYAMIGHTVVAEHRVSSLIREAEHMSHTPEYLERRWGTPTPGARVSPGLARVEGNLEAEQVTAFLEAHQRPLVACYQRGLAEDDDLHGQVVMSFEVQSSGAVQNVTTTVSTVGVEAVSTCLQGAVGDLTFPAPSEGAARVFVALDLRVIPVAAEDDAS